MGRRNRMIKQPYFFFESIREYDRNREGLMLLLLVRPREE